MKSIYRIFDDEILRNINDNILMLVIEQNFPKKPTVLEKVLF